MLTLLLSHIEGDALFIPIDVFRYIINIGWNGASAYHRTSELPGHIAASGTLHPDDLCPPVGEQSPRHWASQYGGELDDSNPLKTVRHVVLSYC